jgi:fibronectin type 3 domain-containing protein
MKKKIITLLFLSMVALGISLVFPPVISKAEEQVTAYQIGFSSYPTKTTYAMGEELDLTGMTVLSVNSDGTSNTITDYTVEGYNNNQIGVQTVTIRYQNCTAYFAVTVVPAKIGKISILNHTTDSYTLSWNAISDISYYELYYHDKNTGTDSLITTVTTNQYTVYDYAGNIKYYKIRAVKELNGTTYVGPLSDAFAAATPPGKVDALMITGTTETSVELSWSMVNGASGYHVYRKKEKDADFTKIGSTSATSYTDSSLSSGTPYQYKVCAYIMDETLIGEASPTADAFTKLAKVNLKYKAGDKKVRLTWNKITGATAYDVYIGDDFYGYTLLASVIGNSNCTYTAEGLINGVTYGFYVIAKGSYQGVDYDGIPSDTVTVTTTELPATNTEAKYFADKAAFLNSSAYQKISFFQKNVVYSKSYIIPGLITTNVGGFVSNSMCPQGITFAKKYLLISAYDLTGEENSVVYILDKASRELLTTVVLPTYAHLGGICFDGKYVWLTTGTKASCILYSDIVAAVASGQPYYNVDFFSVNKLGITASYITYYDDMLWIGSYDELNTTYMYSYEILDYDTEVQLEKAAKMKMPTRVQGIAFTKDGYLLLSRSCQLYKGLRGYMRRLDVYKPDLSEEDAATIPLGKVLNYVYVPSMNEGIAIDGSMLYVLFESAAFANASYKVDRVCAFKLSSVLDKETLAKE